MKSHIPYPCGDAWVKATVALIFLLAPPSASTLSSQETDDSPASLRNDDPNPVLTNAIETLEQHQVSLTSDGMRTYLQLLDPNHPSHKQLEDQASVFVQDLDSADYLIRENATRSLKLMTTVPTRQLTAAAEANNPEVAYRARVILEYLNSRSRRDTKRGIIDSVCVVVEARQIKGMTDVLLETLKLVDDPSTKTAIGNALAATVEEPDLPRLKSALQSDSASQRIASATALSKLLGHDAAPSLEQRLAIEPDDQVRVAFARSLANLGLRSSLPILVELLDSPQIEVRVESIRVLRAATRQSFQFVAYDSPEKRVATVEKWRSWLKENGETVQIQLPILNHHLVIGRILYADYRLNKIVEVDMNGKEVWSRDFQGAWNVQGLPNGHRLASSYQGHTVVEFDREGNEVWKLDRVPNEMMGLHRLDSGNTLVGCGTKVIEYQSDSTVAWQTDVGGRVADCQRLSNGNTLVTLFDRNSVIEIDSQGETVWSVDTANQPVSVCRTDAGTTLVATLGDSTVNEYDREKRVVWSYEAKQPNSAVRRLPNGDTLINSKTEIRLVGPDRNVRWTITGLQHSFGVSAY